MDSIDRQIVSLEKPHYSEHFVSFVNTQDEILECLYLAGDFDCLMKIVTESTETLERLLTRIKSVPGKQKRRHPELSFIIQPPL